MELSWLAAGLPDRCKPSVRPVKARIVAVCFLSLRPIVKSVS
jgi:hypothetical protein